MKKNLIDQMAYAFNIWDIESAKAIIDASVKEKKPIYLQISSKTFDRIDIQEFIKGIKNYITKVKANAVIHLDHSREIKQIKTAIDAGWDSVMYDGSHLSLLENIDNTAKVVELATNRNVIVEGEIGPIFGVEDGISINKKVRVSIEDVEKFVLSTGIDLLAVPIGTAHGQYGGEIPDINYEFLKQICDLVKTPFVVHGGSELPNEILKRLWSFENVKKINISTDIKQAFRMGILKSKKMGLLNEIGFDAFEVNDQIYESIKAVAITKLRLLRDI